MRLFENKRIEYESVAVGQGERSVRIAHLSDLHFPRQCADADALVSYLDGQEIDAAFVTGDLFWRKADLQTCGALAFAERLSALFPVFFSEGNHEARHGRCGEIGELLKARGVHVVTGRCVCAMLGGGTFLIAGDGETAQPQFEGEGIRVLLSHRPERAKAYAETYKPDYIFSGHAHGGQFRIFGRGLFAPGQGILPKYTSGLYPIAESTDLIVSRGIGKSKFPFRLNDPPHVPIVTLSFS